jgi:hypothetical protein
VLFICYFILGWLTFLGVLWLLCVFLDCFWAILFCAGVQHQIKCNFAK